MWFFLLTMVLVSLMIVAIWLGRRATERQREQLEMRQRARQLRQRLNEIAEISSAALKYDGDRALLEAITEFRIHQIEKRLSLLGEQDAEGELATAQAFREALPETLESGKRGLPEEEHEINYMKKQLFKTIKLMKLMQSKGYITEAEVMEHAMRLRIRILKAEVNAYIQHGRTLLKEEDRVNAAAYFKHAKEMLVATNLRFPERTSMIKRISRMIWGVYSTQEDEEELDRELGLDETSRPNAEDSAEDVVERESASLRDEAKTTETRVAEDQKQEN